MTVEGQVKTLVLGSRGSRLALRQAEWVRERIEAAGRPVRIEVIRTSGDRYGDRPLASMGGEGVFVKEIEEVLRSGGVDLAVHSMKDLPTAQPEGLSLVCVPLREDPRDLLVTPDGTSLAELQAGASVGTGSPRRACQIRALRPDLAIRDLRGNLDTRLAKLERGDYDAIVLASAGVRRLGVAVEGTILDLDQMLPAVGQGALAIESRAGDGEVHAATAHCHHPPTAAAVAAERAFLRGVGGGCHAPIAALAEVTGDRMTLRGLVGDLQGVRILRDRVEGPMTEPEIIGARLADRLLRKGAGDLLSHPFTPAPEGND